MIFEATTLISVVSQLREWLGMVDAQEVRNKAEYKAALKSIYDAAFATKRYLVLVKSGEPQNREVEAELSKSWMDAAIELRPINLDLADRCFIKADYWSDPSSWTQQQINEARIGLDTVIKESRQLL